jgi:hypothetical protein
MENGEEFIIFYYFFFLAAPPTEYRKKKFCFNRKKKWIVKASTREPTTSQESDFHFAMSCPVYTVDGMRCVVYGKIREESRSLRISSVNNIHTTGWDKRWWAHTGRYQRPTAHPVNSLSLCLCSIHLKGGKPFSDLKKKRRSSGWKNRHFSSDLRTLSGPATVSYSPLGHPEKKGGKEHRRKRLMESFDKKKKKKK